MPLADNHRERFAGAVAPVCHYLGYTWTEAAHRGRDLDERLIKDS